MKGMDVDGSTVRIRVRPDPEGDLEELEQLTGLLREELLELDVAAVERETDDDEAPEAAKGLASVAGWLVVRLGTLGRWARYSPPSGSGPGARPLLVLRDATNGQELDAVNLVPGHASKDLDPGTARRVYLSDVPCDVRVSAG